MLDVDNLPFLTADVPGIGGKIKTRREDFIVDEVPLYEPAGQGTHVYFRIEKAGLPTMQAVREIARALAAAARDIGYAGLKDADAVTTQTLSLEHVDPTRIQQLDIPRIRVIDVTRHTNKLKLGHLKGNRFRIRLRDVDTNRADDVRSVLTTLSQRGVPNYFGPQRFGLRGDTWQIGRAMLAGDYADAIACILGRVSPRDQGRFREARQLFDNADYEAAAEAWPPSMNNERRLCRAFIKTQNDAAKAFRAVDKRMQQFYLSAFQSQLFNQIVAQRINRLDRLDVGDLAWRHPQGAVFRVEDLAAEQPRCDAFEISPTGPLFGPKMQTPTGAPAEMEQALLDQTNLTAESWRQGPARKTRGARRPLRFQPQDATVDTGTDDLGHYIELAFQLESGCYATCVLREICKSNPNNAD